jgi:hypothetical protein
MEEKKSPLEEVSVSLGSSIKSHPAPAQKKESASPWVMLVCSDFGFRSTQIQRVSSATFKELQSQNPVTIRGTVSNLLYDTDRPLLVEFSGTRVADFSAKNLRTSLASLSDAVSLETSLRRYTEGNGDSNEIGKRLEESTVKSELITPLKQLIVRSSRGTEPRRSSPEKSGRLDSILSSVDLDTKPETPQSKSSDCIDALASGDQSAPSASQIQPHLTVLSETIDKQIAIIEDAPFFRPVKNAWICLRELARSTGRSRRCILLIHSAPVEIQHEHFTSVLTECSTMQLPPDMVVWDYPIRFSAASIRLLSDLLNCCEATKSMLLCSVDDNDMLVKDITTASDVEPLFDDARFLSYKKLRRDSVARLGLLCTPDSIIESSSQAPLSMPAHVPSHWLLVTLAARAIVTEENPFDRLALTEEFFHDTFYSFRCVHTTKIEKEKSSEAGESGIFLIPCGSALPCTLSPHTLIDTQGYGSDYVSLGFNMLVNRVLRLVARHVSSFTPETDTDTRICSLRSFLRAELAAYRIFLKEDEIAVSTNENNTGEIAIDSSETLYGRPISFSFSFNQE